MAKYANFIELYNFLVRNLSDAHFTEPSFLEAYFIRRTKYTYNVRIICIAKAHFIELYFIEVRKVLVMRTLPDRP